MTNVIKHMRDRFLAWRLPEDFAPDGGIEFSQRGPHGPTGTNLFTAVQAEAMIRHMLEGAPAASQPEAGPVAWYAADHQYVTFDRRQAEAHARHGNPLSPLFAHPPTAPVVPAEGPVVQFLTTEDGEFNGNEWEGDLTSEEQGMIDAAWEKHKAAKLESEGPAHAEPVASQISTLEAAYRNMPDIPELPEAYQPRNIAQSLAALRAQQPAAPVSGVTVQEAAIMVADAIDADMRAFNSLVKGFEPRGDWPMKHFFSNALRHYAAALSALEGK